jgi:hypothetical protein
MLKNMFKLQNRQKGATNFSAGKLGNFDLLMTVVGPFMNITVCTGHHT